LNQLDGEAVPEPYKTLLVHLDDMTPTLEKFHHRPIHLQVLGRRRAGDDYFREVVLRLDGTNEPVEFGAIKIHLALFPKEAREQILKAVGRLPDRLFACVGGGSNAIGLFHAFLGDNGVKMTGVEAGGSGKSLGEHASRLAAAEGYLGARPGVLQGTYSYILQTADGQISTTQSVSAGLDYPGVGPEHAWLAQNGRAEYVAVSDAQALDAAKTLSRLEGIIPALESAHAVAEVIMRAPHMKRDEVVIINISGRGDKDMETYSRHV